MKKLMMLAGAMVASLSVSAAAVSWGSGTITLQDWFGSQVFSDDAASNSLGWYNLMQAGVTLKKQ